MQSNADGQHLDLLINNQYERVCFVQMCIQLALSQKTKFN